MKIFRTKKYSNFLNLCILLLFVLNSKSFQYEIENNDNDLLTPTVRLTLNGNNLGELEKIIISKLLVEKNIPIDPLNISQTIDIIGQIDFFLNNTEIKITNSSEGELFASFEEEKNINFILNLLKGEITFDYSFQSKILSSSGNGTIYLNNISLTLNNTIIQVPNENEPNKNGPGIHINALSINDIDMTFTFSKVGTLEKFIKYFNKNLKKILIGVIETKINNEETLEQINTELLNLFKRISLNIPVEIGSIPDSVNISFSMNEEPMVKNNMLEIPLELELLNEHYIYGEKNNITLPCLLNSTSLLNDNVINSIISQFLLNNLLDFMNFYGQINYNITNDTLGLSTPLTVGVFSAFIPELKTKYDTNQKMKIITSAYESPVVKIKEDKFIKINMHENLLFYAYNDTSEYEEEEGNVAVDANSELDFEINFYVNDTDIQLSLKTLSMKSFEVRSSDVGEIDTERVMKNVNTLMTSMIGIFNNKIKQYIKEMEWPINVYGMNLTNVIATTHEDFVKVDLSPVLDTIFEIFS